MSASRKMKNSKGEWITYTPEGKKKDPATWNKLDQQAWAEKRALAAQQGTSTSGRPGSTPAGLPDFPTGAGETSGPSYIGVPSDYRAKVTKTPTNRWGMPKGLPRTTSIAPRYKDGAQFVPASQSPEVVARLQADLVAAGLLDKKDVQLGRWGPESIKAYEEVLMYANASGLTVDQALARYKAQPVQKEAERERAPLVTEVTDPAVLRGTFREVGRSLTGRDLSTEQLDSFIRAFQAVETEKQTQAYNLAEAGGAMVAPPDPSSFIEEKLRAERPEDVKAYGIGSRAEEFFSLLGTPGGL